MWQMLQPFLTYVSAPFENLYREFQEIFSGTPDLPPRWQRCVSRTDSAFGFATGAMFVETILPQNIKEAVRVRQWIKTVGKTFAIMLKG